MRCLDGKDRPARIEGGGKAGTPILSYRHGDYTVTVLQGQTRRRPRRLFTNKRAGLAEVAAGAIRVG